MTYLVLMRQPNTYVLLLSITSYSVILKGTSAKKTQVKLFTHTQKTHTETLRKHNLFLYLFITLCQTKTSNYKGLRKNQTYQIYLDNLLTRLD